MKLFYKSGYKYVTSREFCAMTSVNGFSAENEFIRLHPDGDIIIKGFYAWDGASGPTVDTKNTMRGALVHDALYQLMREGMVPRSQRDEADKTLYRTMREDDMSYLRAQAWLRAVRTFGAGAAKENGGNPERVAP